MTRLNDTDGLFFDAIYRAYGREIYKFLFRMSCSRHDTEDLVQETCIAAMNKLQTFKDESSLKTWIFSIAVNKFRDHHRFGRTRRHDSLEGIERTSNLSPHDELIARETRERVKKAFYSLPEQYQTAFTLVRFEGMSYKEAAGAIGTTLDTVRMRVHRAHIMLAEQLKDK